MFYETCFEHVVVLNDTLASKYKAQQTRDPNAWLQTSGVTKNATIIAAKAICKLFAKFTGVDISAIEMLFESLFDYLFD